LHNPVTSHVTSPTQLCPASLCTHTPHTSSYTLSLHDALPIYGFGDRPGDPAVRPQSENENNHHCRHCEADKDVARTGERGCRKPGASHTNVTPCRRVPCRRPFYERWISEPTSSLAGPRPARRPLAGGAGPSGGRAVGGLLIPA